MPIMGAWFYVAIIWYEREETPPAWTESAKDIVHLRTIDTGVEFKIDA